METKFNTDENLPLNRALNMIIRSIFEEDDKLYP